MIRSMVVAAIVTSMLAGCADARQLARETQPTALTASTATPSTGQASDVDDRFTALDSAVSGAASAPGSLYVAIDESRTVQRIDPASGRVLTSTAVPKSTGSLRGVIHDPGRAAVWLWSDGSYAGHGPNVLTEYDATSLVERRQLDLAGPVQDAAVWGDELWFVDGHHLLVLAGAASAPVTVETPNNGLQRDAGPDAIEIDASGDTIYVTVLSAGYVAVDRKSRKVRATRKYTSKIPSLAMTRSGQLWTSVMQSPDAGPTLLRLDPATLEAIGASPATPPGPTGWSNLIAAKDVVYVEHCCSDAGQPALSCIDGATGRVLQTWTTYTDRPGADWGRGIAPTADGLFVYRRAFTRSTACPG